MEPDSKRRKIHDEGVEFTRSNYLCLLTLLNVTDLMGAVEQLNQLREAGRESRELLRRLEDRDSQVARLESCIRELQSRPTSVINAGQLNQALGGPQQINNSLMQEPRVSGLLMLEGEPGQPRDAGQQVLFLKEKLRVAESRMEAAVQGRATEGARERAVIEELKDLRKRFRVAERELEVWRSGQTSDAKSLKALLSASELENQKLLARVSELKKALKAVQPAEPPAEPPAVTCKTTPPPECFSCIPPLLGTGSLSKTEPGEKRQERSPAACLNPTCESEKNSLVEVLFATPPCMTCRMRRLEDISAELGCNCNRLYAVQVLESISGTEHPLFCRAHYAK